MFHQAHGVHLCPHCLRQQHGSGVLTSGQRSALGRGAGPWGGCCAPPEPPPFSSLPWERGELHSGDSWRLGFDTCASQATERSGMGQSTVSDQPDTRWTRFKK